MPNGLGLTFGDYKGVVIRSQLNSRYPKPDQLPLNKTVKYKNITTSFNKNKLAKNLNYQDTKFVMHILRYTEQVKTGPIILIYNYYNFLIVKFT